MPSARHPKADQGLSGPHRPSRRAPTTAPASLTVPLDPLDLAALEVQASELGIAAAELAQHLISQRLHALAAEMLEPAGGRRLWS